MSKQLKKIPLNKICHQCIGESYLSNLVVESGSLEECTYCAQEDICYSIEDLSDLIDTAFREHFIRTANQPDGFQERMLADKESSYVWYRDGIEIVEAIEYEAQIPTQAAIDVQESLEKKYEDFDAAMMGEECEYSSESHYAERTITDYRWRLEWEMFETSLKTEARFFSQIATLYLDSLFNDIDKFKTASSRSLIVNAGPKRRLNHLYRARVFQTKESLEESLAYPDIHLGPPPMRLASAGRMNARGISVFYGATTERTAIAEVRPPVGSKVVVADFRIIKDLRLLDLTALPHVREYGSIFDSTLIDRLEKVAFLRTLGDIMSRPVMPDDEALDYLATQAVADYLANENDPVFDGVIFQSAQVKNGRNILLFHKAARVEKYHLPKDTTIDVNSYFQTEDGFEMDYSVSETVPKVTEQIEQPDPKVWLRTTKNIEILDDREDSLRIKFDELQIHEIKYIAHHSVKHRVRRYRNNSDESAF